MNLEEESISLLRSAGYGVRPVRREALAVEFEDEAVFGFIAEYATVAALLDHWKSDQDAYLRERVVALRDAAEKRANVYAVFLTSGKPSPDEMREMAAIEENFVSTRKVVAGNVSGREQLRTVLLPLLPLQVVAQLSTPDMDRRLESRLVRRPDLYLTLRRFQDPTKLIESLLSE